MVYFKHFLGEKADNKYNKLSRFCYRAPGYSFSQMHAKNFENAEKKGEDINLASFALFWAFCGIKNVKFWVFLFAYILEKT